MEENKNTQGAIKGKCPCAACNLIVNIGPLDLSEEKLESIIREFLHL